MIFRHLLFSFSYILVAPEFILYFRNRYQIRILSFWELHVSETPILKSMLLSFTFTFTLPHPTQNKSFKGRFLVRSRQVWPTIRPFTIGSYLLFSAFDRIFYSAHLFRAECFAYIKNGADNQLYTRAWPDKPGKLVLVEVVLFFCFSFSLFIEYLNTKIRAFGW